MFKGFIRRYPLLSVAECVLSESMAAATATMSISAAIPVTGTAIMVAEFRQGVKGDFFDVFTDRRPLRLEHPHPAAALRAAGVQGAGGDGP